LISFRRSVYKDSSREELYKAGDNMAYRATKSGFAAEAQQKVEANFDVNDARKCLQWIQAVSQTDKIPSNPGDIDASHDNFYQLLHDGVVLLQVMDKLMPGKVNWNDKMFQTPKIEAMRLMRERERISTFTKLVTQYGVADTYAFPTESIHEQGALNLAQVCNCIRALGIEAQTKPSYPGPAGFWQKKAERNTREFTEEQLKEGQNIISLQYGTNKGASQAGMNIGKMRSIHD